MRNYVIAIVLGFLALSLLCVHAAFAQAVPDPVADPLASLSLVEKLYRSGALVATGIVAAFFALTYASAKVAWLQTHHHAVYVSALLGGLALLVGPASQGQTPNASMLVSAAVAAVALALNPKKPATLAVARGDLPPGADAPKPALPTGSTALVLIVLLGLGVAGSQVGCGPNAAQQRQTTLQAALVTTDTACASFAAYDLKHQEDLKAAAHASGATLAEVTDTLAKWRAQRDVVVKACKLTLDAIKAGATVTDDKSIQALTAAAGILADALHTLGVSQ